MKSMKRIRRHIPWVMLGICGFVLVVLMLYTDISQTMLSIKQQHIKNAEHVSYESDKRMSYALSHMKVLENLADEVNGRDLDRLVDDISRDNVQFSVHASAQLPRQLGLKGEGSWQLYKQKDHSHAQESPKSQTALVTHMQV